MMQLLRRWSYPLFLIVVVTAVTIHNRNVVSMLLPISFLLGTLVYTQYKKSHKWIWLVTIGTALALVMGGIYYVADAILFPHSQQAAQRLSEACMLGPMSAVFGLLFPAAISPLGRRANKTMP